MTQALILDTDPGIDDAMALLLILASPELELLGVTTVFGNNGVAQTTHNALHVLNVVNRTDIPVVAGAGRPPVAAATPWARDAARLVSLFKHRLMA